MKDEIMAETHECMRKTVSIKTLSEKYLKKKKKLMSLRVVKIL